MLSYVDKQNLAAAAAVVIAAAAAWVWRSKRCRTVESPYEDLAGPVSFSSRPVAAYRALESEEEQPLFVDALAEVLAGKVAMAEARSAARRCDDNGNGAQAGHAKRRKFKVTRMGLRTKWIDTRIEDATTVGAVKQVVVLGSGQDARPWRLKIGKGVNWFECDMADVIAAKRTQLEGAGAQVEVPAAGIKPPRHPLQVSQWHPFVCDLSQRGWHKTLAAEGWKREQPTIWVLEGLLMYLDQDASELLLKEMGELSASGSIMLVMFLRAAFKDGVMHDYSQEAKMMRDLKNSFKSWVPYDIQAYLKEHGNWQLVEENSVPQMMHKLAEGLQADVHEGSGRRGVYCQARIA